MLNGSESNIASRDLKTLSGVFFWKSKYHKIRINKAMSRYKSSLNGYKHKKWIQEYMKWIHAHEIDVSTRNGCRHMKWNQAHEMDTRTSEMDASIRNGYMHTKWIQAQEKDTST